MSEITRIRASKACQRCSQRKIKCDATNYGIPCSRCRSDGVDGCKFSASRRGAHQRKKQRILQPSDDGTDLRRNSRQGIDSLRSGGLPDEQSVGSQSPPNHTADIATTMGASNARSASDSTRTQSIRMRQRRTTAANRSIASSATMVNSPGNTFVEFMKRKACLGNTTGGSASLMLLAESSPLSFALAETATRNPVTAFDGVDLEPEVQARIRENHIANPVNSHPTHMSPDDISYLQSKGAFDYPDVDLADDLIRSFTLQFYPLYSIVDKVEFQSLYDRRRLPWILLHAVCLIGATFCNASVIHRSPFRQRLAARQHFYQKTKILFDVGYETDKIVLLQSVLMLTFWGPQITMYWNPSTWVDFATTIAASLGVHRKSNSEVKRVKDVGLLRRLWWTVLVRDAYCAALLGRPFRTRMSQCDAAMLDIEDFNADLSSSRTEEAEQAQWISITYQVQMAELSLIFRKIMHFHSGKEQDPARRTELHDLLRNWHDKLPARLDWTKQHQSETPFVTSLKIAYHHHLIILYLSKREKPMVDEMQTISAARNASELITVAAQSIASSALIIMTNACVSSMPQEIYQGYFIAGIIFHRQMQQQDPSLAEFRRAALDNCQMVLNAACETYDAARWMLSIFEFLLSSPSRTAEDASGGSSTYRRLTESSTIVVDSNHQPSEDHIDYNDFGFYSTDWDLPLQYDATDMVDDFLSIPNLYAPVDTLHTTPL